MQCKRCLNTDKQYFYKGSNGWYCRKCISFGRAMLAEDMTPVSLQPIHEESEEYRLQYPLTDAQKEMTEKCASLIQNRQDVLLNCVCGAGKTELVTLSISQMLKEKKKVCFAIPRRQVVLELRERLSRYFPKAKVTGVCGGYTSQTDGDLIICTTHQLYRYYQAFDLLILDEPDAFPFRGNDVLHGIAKTSCKGNLIYLTATPDEEMMKRVKEGTLIMLELKERPHGKPLPVPQVIISSVLMLPLLCVWLNEHQKHPRMVFVPSVNMAEKLYMVLHLFYECDYCTSKSEDRDKKTEHFRNAKNGILICTTVMERGVTIPGVDICVYQAEHAVFDKAGLIQMAGRAGRTFQYPQGDVLFLCKERSSLVETCIREIKKANESVYFVQ
ncbi:MAG: DEAD/DEAH box helicase family protein [Solobacterium sp.]|nr:DEAD/DEAH box helicase family protein [Solobacterium sp.]